MSTSLPEWLKAGGVVLLCTTNNDGIHMFKVWLLLVLRQRKIFLWQTNGKTVFFSGIGIDTAYDYYSSEDIASVLKRHPHIKRSSLFITTKVLGYLSNWLQSHVMICHKATRMVVTWCFLFVLQVPGGLGWWTNGHQLDTPQPPGLPHDFFL